MPLRVIMAIPIPMAARMAAVAGIRAAGAAGTGAGDTLIRIIED